MATSNGRGPAVQDDGRTKILLGSQEFTLRRPNFGQYKQLRRLVFALPEEVRVIAGDEEEERPRIEVAEATDEVTLKFWTEAFQILEEHGQAFPYPDIDQIPDDAPLWIIDPVFVGTTLRDMRTRPAAPGSR